MMTRSTLVALISHQSVNIGLDVYRVLNSMSDGYHEKSSDDVEDTLDYLENYVIPAYSSEDVHQRLRTILGWTESAPLEPVPEGLAGPGGYTVVVGPRGDPRRHDTWEGAFAALVDGAAERGIATLRGGGRTWTLTAVEGGV